MSLSDRYRGQVARLLMIKKNHCLFTPGRYVGEEAAEDDGEPFEEKMQRLTAKLEEQFHESALLGVEIRAILKGLSYEI
jgi:type I restriction enzyme M protein